MLTASGFDTEFLAGHPLALPTADRPEVSADVEATQSGDPVRACTHFSLCMSASRKLCRWVAWNVDGSTHRATTRDARQFSRDPAYLPDEQIGAGLYAHDAFDAGHIASFSDLSWGSEQEAAEARKESCFYSNVTPQLESFNRSSLKGLWGGLEAQISKENDVDAKRLSVFGGPILAAGDPRFRDVQIPRQFWKVIAYVEAGTLKAKGFTLTQPSFDVGEQLALASYRAYQRRISELADDLGLSMPGLVTADTAPPAAAGTEGIAPEVAARPLLTLADVNAPGW